MLKSLELHGFKSFADRTRFDFSPGITAVVGPNGSGKSNVVDGIKWILGDQSPRSLRGKEMTDVIFNGAAGRKPSALAEATLTFDNSSGFLPIEPREVQIGRRLWRGGDSEYLINRVPARLKDVRDLFMGTGAGNAAYSIIEQGRVDQILQSSAVNRRQIFEEAAGISRYKARKVDALRKLERVDQNLLRLKDIVAEVETRLVALRGQAAKAHSWRELTEELRELWLGLAADEYRHSRRELGVIEAASEACEQELSECHARQETLERELSSLDSELALVEDRLREAELRVALTREAAAHHTSTVGHQTARLRELDADLSKLRRQRVLMLGRSQETLAELAASEDVLRQSAAQLALRRAALERSAAQADEISTSIAAQRAALAARRHELLAKMRVVSGAEGRVGGLETRRESLEREREAALQRGRDLDEQIALRKTELDRRVEAYNRAAAELAESAGGLQHIRSERQCLSTKHGDGCQVLSELRESRSAGQARLAILEEWEQRQQGIALGVREILERSRTHDYPPWSRILGCVADLLQVELEHAALVEIALERRAQLVVVEEFDSLLEYVSSASCRIAGRVGFLTHADEHFRPWPITGNRDLSSFDGIVGRADRFVRSPPEFPELAERLLADTWIVETLATALRLAAGPGQGHRFVTLQGELLEPDGTLVVGTPRSDTGIVSRKSELRQLKNDLVLLEARIQQEQRLLAQLDQRLVILDEQIASAEQELASAAEQHSRRKAELAGQEQEVQALRRARHSAQAEAARIAADDELLTQELTGARNQLDQARSELQQAQTEIARLESEIAADERQLDTLQQRITADRIEFSRHEERVTALRAADERLQYEHRQRALQSEEGERRYDGAIAKRREITLQILNTSALLAELALEEERFLAEAERFVESRTSVKGRRADLVREETSLRQRRRELGDRQHTEEIRQRDLQHQLDTLARRIEDEYQLSLQDVVASGASAVQAYIRRNQSSPAPEDDSQNPPIDSAPPPASRDSAEETDPAAYSEIHRELQERIERLRRKLKGMGGVNIDSLQDLDELEQRFALQHAQLQDLVEAKAALEDIIRRINAESKRLFVETFEAVRGHFQHLFRRAFGGGDGDLVLEDPDDVLECGIEIVARPPGKELKSISLLSGGEKALTAFALLLALFKTRPSPYCLLDEVDAPLDEANVGRLGALLEEFKGSTQFIVITHKKPTMTIADVLYGVTMEESGVSKRMSVRFEDVSENGEFTTRAAAA